jgi:hypothetical protein
MMNFLPRLLIGATILAGLAVYDLCINRHKATRWREYVFLLFCVAVAMIYGIINDQITSRISWEYFYYGKVLAPILGPQTPPDSAALSWQAVRIGVEATWSAGLIAGAALLIANNPSVNPRLTYRRLAATLPVVIAITIAFASLFGWAGYHFWLNSMGDDLAQIAQTNLWRPHRFLLVYGIHLGGYVGGAVAIILSFISIRLERRRLKEGGNETEQDEMSPLP